VTGNPEGELDLPLRNAGTAAKRGQIAKSRELYAQTAAMADRLDAKEVALASLAAEGSFAALIGNRGEALQLAEKIRAASFVLARRKHGLRQLCAPIPHLPIAEINNRQARSALVSNRSAPSC
jgi:hypothetical protein